MDATAIIIWIVIGLVAGWLASIVVGGAGSLLGYLIAGLIGSVVGGWLAGQFNWSLNLGNPIVERIIISFIGAIIVLLVVRLIRGG